MDDVGAAADERGFQVGLQRECHLGGPADDEMCFDRQRAQQLEEARPVDHP